MLFHLKIAIQKKVKRHIKSIYNNFYINYLIKNFINDLFNEFDLDIKIYYERIENLKLNRNNCQHNILINIIFK